MHTIRQNGIYWEVGYYRPRTHIHQDEVHQWNSLMVFNDVRDAAGYCSFLNGGLYRYAKIECEGDKAEMEMED